VSEFAMRRLAGAETQLGLGCVSHRCTLGGSSGGIDRPGALRPAGVTGAGQSTGDRRSDVPVDQHGQGRTPRALPCRLPPGGGRDGPRPPPQLIRRS
jgi:hypothetical protein